MKILKSIGAIFAGFISVAILSIATDFILEKTGVFPPHDKLRLFASHMAFIAFIYRSVYTVLGGFITAKLAFEKPMLHAMILAVIGTIMAILGAVANWDKTSEATHWYPIALAVTALPCIWLGVFLFLRGSK